jgi:methylenetetrahydrofolate reductase (NADPH)
VVTDELWELCQKYASGPDRGKRFFAELAAKQLAVLRGLGFAAGYLGGIHKLESLEEVLRHLDSFAPDDWRQFLKEIRFSFPDEFFFFEHDPETGLSEPDKINREYLESLKKPRRSRYVTWGYRLSRLVHRIAFTRGKGLWNLAQKLYQRWAGKPQPPASARLLYGLEKFSKYMMYGCQDCGDCSLPDCAYVCPKRWCSKCSRNGPCGGSMDGQCELRDKECLWAIVYERLKAYGESEEMLAGPPVLYNAELAHTSSWANTYLNRDHHRTAEKRDLNQDTLGGANTHGQ